MRIALAAVRAWAVGVVRLEQPGFDSFQLRLDGGDVRVDQIVE